MQYLEGLIWFVLSILLGIKSIQLGLGTFASPGPGFMPFGVALVIFILSIILFIKSYFLRDASAGQNLNLRISPFVIILSLIVYVFVFKEIGYILSNFLLWIIIFRFMGTTKRWIWAGIESIFVTLLSYVIFGLVLKLYLPTGHWVLYLLR